MSAHSSQRATWLALIFLTVIWALNWTVMKSALDFSGPFVFSALRYAVATVVLFALLAYRPAALKPSPWWPTLAIGLTQIAAFQTCAQLALITGGAGKTAILSYTLPFWVVPLAWWWLHEKPGLLRWGCIAVAAVGLVCVVSPWQRVGDPLSIVLALASGLVWAVGTVVSKRVFEQHPEVTPLQLTAWTMLVGTVVLLILWLIIPERPVHWTDRYMAAVLYSGLLSSSIGWALWALIVKRLPANVSGLTSLAVPVAGVLFAWGLLGERPSLAEWVGIALIAVALLTLNFSSHSGANQRTINRANSSAP